jgi:hypothetical protein
MIGKAEVILERRPATPLLEGNLMTTAHDLHHRLDREPGLPMRMIYDRKTDPHG